MKNPFPPESRYHGLELAELEVSEFVSVAYLRRRFVPGADRFALLIEHRVKEHERLDRITALHLGNPELFWRLCDANAAMQPVELERFGRRLRITLPEGLPAPGGVDV
jgi:hypothetical protein